MRELVIKWHCYVINKNANFVFVVYVNSSLTLTKAVVAFDSSSDNNVLRFVSNAVNVGDSVICDNVSCRSRVKCAEVGDDVVALCVNSKHTVLSVAKQRFVFYNGVISHVKQSGMTITFHSADANVFHIYTLTSSSYEHMFTLSYTSTPYVVVDFLLLNETLLYAIVRDKCEHNYKLLQMQLSAKHSKERIAYQTDTPLHLVNAITNANGNDYIVLISLYGEIVFFKVDVHGSCDYCGSFVFEFSDTEMMDVHAVVKANVNEVYVANDKLKVFEQYKFVKAHVKECCVANGFKYIEVVFMFDKGYVCFVLMESEVTYTEKLIQCNTITVDTSTAPAVAGEVTFNVDAFTFTYNSNSSNIQ